MGCHEADTPATFLGDTEISQRCGGDGYLSPTVKIIRGRNQYHLQLHEIEVSSLALASLVEIMLHPST